MVHSTIIFYYGTSQHTGNRLTVWQRR